MIKLIVHIGASKCGSSAIQDFLGKNRNRLKVNGVLVPGNYLTPVDTEVSGDQLWFFNDLLHNGFDKGKAIVHERMERLREYSSSKGIHTIIVSAENLCNPLGFENYLIGLENLFDLEIVFYIRRQDDFLISAWQQWNLKESDSIADWLANALGTLGNWSEYLRPWEKAFGRERIILRQFSRSKLVDGDVVKDFLSCLKIPTDHYEISDMRENRSFDEIIGMLAHDVNDVFSGIHDDRLYKMFKRFGGEKVYNTRKGSSLFSLDERRSILNKYLDGNIRLNREYFNGERETLFENPTEDDVYRLSSQEVLDGKISTLTRIIFGLYNTIVKMEDEMKLIKKGHNLPPAQPRMKNSSRHRKRKKRI